MRAFYGGPDYLRLDGQRVLEWSDIFLPQIKKIVGPLLLEPASFELDASEATDLVVLKARDMRIGCRVRR